MFALPGLGLGQEHAAIQQASITMQRLPRLRRFREAAMDVQRLAVRIKPRAELRPARIRASWATSTRPSSGLLRTLGRNQARIGEPLHHRLDLFRRPHSRP